MTQNVFTGQVSDGTIVFKTAAGDVVGVEPGSVVWSSSDDTVMTVSGDDSSFHVETVGVSMNDAGGNPLPTRVSFTADADATSGAHPIAGQSEEVFVTMNPSGLASTFEITFGPFTDKAGGPAPTP